MKKKVILLTGATGFLGSHIVKTLHKKYFFICLKRSFSDMKRLVNVQNKCVFIDIDKEGFVNVFNRFEIDVVIHCATNYARQPELCFDAVNSDLVFPLQLLELSKKNKIKLFINTDSFFSKGLNGKIKESAYLWNYTISKSFFTTFAYNNAQYLNVAFVNMCLEHVYGNDEGKDKFVNFIITALKANQKEIELTEGLQERDFIFVEDVVNAFDTILKNISKFQKNKFYPFEVGTGKTTSIKHFVEIAKEKMGSSSTLCFGARPMSNGELMYSCANNTNLKQLGWEPKYNLLSGLKKIIENT